MIGPTAAAPTVDDALRALARAEALADADVEVVLDGAGPDRRGRPGARRRAARGDHDRHVVPLHPDRDPAAAVEGGPGLIPRGRKVRQGEPPVLGPSDTVRVTRESDISRFPGVGTL